MTRRHGRLFPVGVLLGIVFLAVLIATFISVPYYAITPGDGLSVASLIHVPKALSHQHKGEVLLTDVELIPLRAIDYLYYKFDHNAQIVPTAQLTSGASTSQYDAQGSIDMVNARQAAAVAAFRALGYEVNVVEDGVIVYQPIANSPVAATLAVGDVITGVDHRATPTGEALRTVLAGLKPGTDVVVDYHGIAKTQSHMVSVRLGAQYGVGSGRTASAECLDPRRAGHAKLLKANGAALACLGVEIEQSYRVPHLPIPVTIDAHGIIGPSAGLAYTLGLIEKLDRADLMDGRRIAATGTMSIDGSVGDVGGVAQKTVAVRSAGATVFFVPPQEKSVAVAHAGSNLRVFAVANVSQALRDLRSLGGKISKAAPTS